MPRHVSHFLIILLAVASFAAQAAHLTAEEASSGNAPDAARIAELEKTLTNAALIGHFTVTGEAGSGEDSAQLTEERYELGDVKHLSGEQWSIAARIKYGDHDVTVPLALPIRWAGDTPMICVDELAIPGLGSFTARVMIYRDHYAGFWTGADHGGHLFGQIERGEKNPETDANADK